MVDDTDPEPQHVAVYERSIHTLFLYPNHTRFDDYRRFFIARFGEGPGVDEAIQSAILRVFGEELTQRIMFANAKSTRQLYRNQSIRRSLTSPATLDAVLAGYRMMSKRMASIIGPTLGRKAH